MVWLLVPNYSCAYSCPGIDNILRVNGDVLVTSSALLNGDRVGGGEVRQRHHLTGFRRPPRSAEENY
jgi:hypothetical protein